MKITTRSRYALRFMLELSMNGKQGYMRLSEISDSQGLSKKYMENIVTTLKHTGLVKAERGKAGGYKLSKRPEEYTVGVIIKLFEGNLEQASCDDCESKVSACEQNCSIIKLRKELDQSVDDVLEHTTLADLVTWEKLAYEQ